MIVHYRNLGYGWAQIARRINSNFHTIRTPNQLNNNYNQRLKKIHPNVRPDIKNTLAPEESKEINKSTSETTKTR
jgi:hypothetical protein